MDSIESAKRMGLFSRAFLVVSVALLVVIAAGVLWLTIPAIQFAVGPDPFPATVLSTVSSPDGKLSLVGNEYDHGGLGGEVVITVVGHGSVVLDRRLASDSWGSRPSMSWVDSRTVDISGRRLDAYRSEWIDFRE